MSYREERRSNGYRENYGSGRQRSYSRSPSPPRRRSPPPRSYGGGGGGGGRYGRRDGRDNPPPSKCIGVFGMSQYTSERDLSRHFSRYGVVDRVQLITDKFSGRSRGFGFVYFEDERDAKQAREDSRDLELDGRVVRVDYSVSDGGGPPRPGGGGGGYGGGGGGGRGSRSPRRRSRSRSNDRGRY